MGALDAHEAELARHVGAVLAAIAGTVEEVRYKQLCDALHEAGCTREILKQRLLKGQFRIYLLRTKEEREFAAKNGRGKILEVAWAETPVFFGGKKFLRSKNQRGCNEIVASLMLSKSHTTLTFDRVGSVPFGQKKGKFAPQTRSTPAFKAAQCFLHENCGNGQGFIPFMKASKASLKQRCVRVVRTSSGTRIA